MNSVYARLVIYILSTLLGSIPAVALGWFSYQFVDGLVHITIDPEGAILALTSGGLLSLGVLKKWGTQ